MRVIFDICLITMAREKHKRLTHASGCIGSFGNRTTIEELAQDKADTKYM